MTKSNMRSAGLRKANIRIQRATVDRRELLQARAYESRQERNERTPPEVQATIEWWRGMVKSVHLFLGELFRFGRGTGFTSSISNLNITRGRYGGGMSSDKPTRDAGAQYLRSVFGSQLKMVSTRDGRKV